MTEAQNLPPWKALEIVSVNALNLFFEDSTGRLDVNFFDSDWPMFLVIGTNGKGERRIIWQGDDATKARTTGAEVSAVFGIEAIDLTQIGMMQ